MAYLFEDRGSFVYHNNDGEGGKTWNNHIVRQGEFNIKMNAAVNTLESKINTVYSYLDTQTQTKDSKLKELSLTLEAVQHENKSLRDELQLLRATLVEILDTLTQGAHGSPKDGPCAVSSSVQ
jgi:hypothetical protein